MVLIFLAIAPTLSWPQFSGDSEDLLVQTVLEMRHGGPWWVPTLGGHPRTRKPPLPAWITAAAVSPQTVRDLDSAIPEVRESAYRHLAWQVRWPGLLAGCLALLAIAWMAEVAGGPAHVIPTVVIAATMVLFLRFVRSATTDVHLLLWVSVANAFFAVAVIQNRRWLGCVGGGAAVGLALMCKGPVALVVTVLPFAVFATLRNRKVIPRSLENQTPRAKWVPVVLTGFFCMLAIALPWYISTLVSTPGAAAAWWNELRGEGTKSISRDPWLAYWTLLPNVLPWLPLFLAGGCLMWPGLRRARRISLPLFLLIVPIVVLSLFHDRKERYLLPLVGPVALIAAHAAVRLKRRFILRTRSALIVWKTHWIVLCLLAIGMPAMGMFYLKRIDGQPWYPIAGGIAAMAVGFGIVTLGWICQSRWRCSFVAATVAVLLLANAAFLSAWSQSAHGHSEMKPVADRLHLEFPGQTVVYFNPTNDKPVTLDLDIYLDRPVPVTSLAPPATVYEHAGAIVLLQGSGEPAPHFAGWQPAFDLVSRNHHWMVLRRE